MNRRKGVKGCWRGKLDGEGNLKSTIYNRTFLLKKYSPFCHE